jgi:hypothetical protein
LINFTLERFGDTAGRLLAVEARTAHVRFGLTYVFIVRAEAGISKLEWEWEGLRVRIVASTDKPGRAALDRTAEGGCPHMMRRQDGGKQGILEILNLED